MWLTLSYMYCISDWTFFSFQLQMCVGYSHPSPRTIQTTSPDPRTTLALCSSIIGG
jgi:hypothetical protein